MVAPASIETYVDHELSANLDSSNAFEGPEKLLEVWFFESEAEVQGPKEGLRGIPMKEWIKILDLVHCKILSVKSSDFMDAYLLSESSFFVFPHKLILKTCGTTTTLACIEQLFTTARKYLSLNFQGYEASRVFYSRRSFMFPEKQKHVHTDWKNELSHLNSFFRNGKSYIVGNCLSDDHWYLYLAGSNMGSSKGFTNGRTFEILMTELDQDSMKKFYTDRLPGSSSFIENGDDGENHDLGHDLGRKTMKESLLDSLFEPRETRSHLPSPSLSDMELDETDLERGPFRMKKQKDLKFMHDAFSFYPCGFSSNSISTETGPYYYTLHITPESEWSYASFETNYLFERGGLKITIDELLQRVLSIFKPGSFSATLFTQSEEDFSELSVCSINKGYEKNDRIVYDLQDGNKLLYLNYSKAKERRDKGEFLGDIDGFAL